MSFLFKSVPAQDDAVVALLQPLDDAKHILREGKTNHNVKNVLAAAIRAAEKDATGDIRDKRIIDEAKKVLAQFDTAAQDGAAQDYDPNPATRGKDIENIDE